MDVQKHKTMISRQLEKTGTLGRKGPRSVERNTGKHVKQEKTGIIATYLHNDDKLSHEQRQCITITI